MNLSKTVFKGLPIALVVGALLFMGTTKTRGNVQGTQRQAGQGQNSPTDTKFDWEHFLRKAKILSVSKETSGGRTRPWIVFLDDGKIKRRALFKHLDFRRPRPAPDSYRYEMAAYELTKLIGFRVIPPLVERVIDGKKGSLQVYLENFVSERERIRKQLAPPDPLAHTRFIEGLKVLEILVYDECGDLDDTWVEREDGQIFRVDFSEAFFPAKYLPPNCEITVCSRRLYKGLKELEDSAMTAVLTKHLNKEEIESLLVRKKLILDRIETLIAERGEAAVLF